MDLLYPGVCHRCGEGIPGDRSLCEPCDLTLPSLRTPFCRKCGEEFEGRIEGDFECPNCRDLRFSFDFARPALPNHPALLGMIHELKYLRRIHFGVELGRLTARAFAEDPRLAEALEGKWPLIPVPLHRRRLVWRHFNQAEEIARSLGRHTGLPVCRALSRLRGTESQTRLSRAQRLKNLKGAFALSVSGRKFTAGNPPGAILVDDVFTTGATTNECARVLRRAGVQKVVVVTAMRG
ncbi:ComF family protein [Luteolibacter luteus]|uniref:ComF family protein n=1 Tax=Luteolibacter luteus TaxID=2728835 RepID=A0A858RPL5_9BACT|nr:ComF family protein [Luteolibacter luteus]QJE98328.1 ComF family protein [Luteolibacter luteus]